MSDPPFRDRAEAGRRLGRALAEEAGPGTLVVALPRGGVPVAAAVARALDAPLEVLIVRKIGAPGHPEYGVGAVVEGAEPTVALNAAAIAMLGAAPEAVEAETARQVHEIARRREAYRGDRPAPDPRGRTAIVVDDGAATGGTMVVALRALREAGAARLVAALPVAAPDALALIEAEADAVVSLLAPPYFRAVGDHYAAFHQLADTEVIEALAAARRPAPR